MRLRTLVLCDAVGHDGGTESYLSRIIPALRSRGCDVIVRARSVRDAGAFGSGDVGSIAWAGEDDAPSPAAAAEVVATVAACQPDAVLLSNVFDSGVVAAARSVRRLVIRIHDHRAFCPNGNRVFPQFRTPCTQRMGVACIAGAVVRGCASGPHPASFERLRRRLALRGQLLQADAFVVSSNYMRTGCITNGVEAGQILVAPPPVDPAALATLPADRASGPRRVLFAGRIVAEKGLMSLVGALARIPAARRPALAVAGEPTPVAAEAAARAAARGVEFTLLGRLDASALRAAYDASDAIALPSLWPEPFGLVGIEAFARGRPVAPYDVGGVRDWIGTGGIAARPADQRSLADALETVLDGGRWAAFSASARRIAERFTPEAHATRLLTALAS